MHGRRDAQFEGQLLHLMDTHYMASCIGIMYKGCMYPYHCLTSDLDGYLGGEDRSFL